MWSLQDAIAYETSQYLSKQYTMSQFDIGLDPNLHKMNLREQEYRQHMSDYAKHDCLAMQSLLIEMEFTNRQPQPTTGISSTEIVKFLHDSDDDESLFTSMNNQCLTTSTDYYLGCANESNPVEQIPVNTTTTSSSSNILHQLPAFPSSTTTQKNLASHETDNRIELTKEECKRIHNRSCTLKQRQKYYRHEIIKRDIDRRFTITDIKTILQQYDIQFSAINTTTSRSKQRILFIGIKNERMLRMYEERLKHCFTRRHYHEYIEQMRSFVKDDRYRIQRRHHRAI